MERFAASLSTLFPNGKVNLYVYICIYYTYNNNVIIRTNIRTLKTYSNIWLTFEYTEYSDIRPRLARYYKVLQNVLIAIMVINSERTHSKSKNGIKVAVSILFC